MPGLINPDDFVVGPAKHVNTPNPGDEHLASECTGGPDWPCSAHNPPPTKATELKTMMRSMLMDHFGPIIDRYIDEHWPDETYTGTPVDFVSNTAGQIDVGRIEDLLGFWSRQPESMFIEENGSIFVNEINMVEVNRHTGEMDVI